MYEEYYGFVQSPFTLAPDPRFLYRSESHDEALQLLLQAIRRKEGFIVLTGDIGTGKTTLCRALLEQLDSTTFTALILNPFLSVEELLREILLDFGVVSQRGAAQRPAGDGVSKHDLVSTLHDFLLSLVPLHGSGVLIIDEAQHLSPEVLEADPRPLEPRDQRSEAAADRAGRPAEPARRARRRRSCASSISASRSAASLQAADARTKSMPTSRTGCGWRAASTSVTFDAAGARPACTPSPAACRG